MKLSRNVSGSTPQAALRLPGIRHRPTARLPLCGSRTQVKGEHHEVIPLHDAIKVKTLSSILKSVARHHEMDVEELLRKLDL